MTGVLLAVNHGDAVVQAKGNQCGNGYLGGVGGVREHRLAEHHAAHVDAIKTANQLATDPGFDAVRVPSGMQGAVGFNHIRDDPRATLAKPRSGCAGLDDRSKSAVEPDFT